MTAFLAPPMCIGWIGLTLVCSTITLSPSSLEDPKPAPSVLTDLISSSANAFGSM